MPSWMDLIPLILKIGTKYHLTPYGVKRYRHICVPFSINQFNQGGASILRHYGSLFKALVSLFPDTSWDFSKFDCTRVYYLNNSYIYLFIYYLYPEKQRRKAVLEGYAQLHGFDPLNLLRWYKQKPKTFRLSKVKHHWIQLHTKVN